LIESYIRFVCVHRNLAERTRNKREWQLARFSSFLDINGVHDITSIQPSQIRQFLLGLEGQKSATILTYGVTLRSFFRWAFLEKVLPMDFSSAAMSAPRYRQSAIRDVLGESEIEHILSAVDRSTAIGRRDFAVLLLAARYGLRPCDIRQLSLDDILWRKEMLTVHQSKTKRLLTLPLLRDVAHALSEYLQHARPVTQARQVFVRHRAPFEPFVPCNNLATIMQKALRCGGFADRTGRRGLYLFRHTLATRMLSAGCPMKSISDVLGHSSTETTMEYANVDLNALRTVAISEAEVR
jgi:site-specific recombinase XerD